MHRCMRCLESIHNFLGKKGKENGIDDSDWDEVKLINGYAVFMGYLLMGVKGLGILVVTWTTVVLLGGFVSVLEKNDFWCLTGITLVQTAGVFNFLLEEKLSDILHSRWGLLAAVFSTVLKEVASRRRFWLAYALSFIQLLMFAALLCPLAVMYMFGLYISTGVSLWRLIKHDFGNGDGSANLKPALEVLYSLAVAQGLLFGYKQLYAIGAKIALAELMAENCYVDKKIVSGYLDNIVEGCEKDPSFATGRNLVTYAVHLMLEPKSNDCFIVGVRALGTIIENNNGEGGEVSRLVLAKHLLTTSGSCSHTIQRLLETLGPRSPYSTEIREHAARIVWLVAGSMYLEQFPRGIQCISSLLDTIEPHQGHSRGHNSLPKEYERHWLLDDEEKKYQSMSRDTPGLRRDCAACCCRFSLSVTSLHDSAAEPNAASESPESDSNLLRGYARLIIQGLRIIQKLIVDEDNRRVIINTQGLLPKIIIAPLISDKLHRYYNEEWNSLLDESWELMKRLMAAPGETGTKPQCKISSSNSRAIITTLEIILCQECEAPKKRQAIEMLLNLSVDTSYMKDSENRMYTWILLLTYLLGNGVNIKKLAGEKLQAIPSLQSEGSEMGMLQPVRVVLADITGTLVDSENSTNRVHAAQILKHLCLNYTKEYLEELKNAMVNVMPKVLKETLGYRSTRGEIKVVIGANDDKLSEGSKLHEALVSLCSAVRLWIGGDTNLTRQYNEITERVCSEQEKPAKNFSDLVEEIEELQEVGRRIV